MRTVIKWVKASPWWAAIGSKKGTRRFCCWLVQCVYNVDNCNVTNAWYFYLYLTIFTWYLLVLYCLLSPQPASRPLLLVVDWSQLSDNTRGGVIHHHHPISFFIICFKIRLSIIILTMTNLIITKLSHIFQSASHGASAFNFKILRKLVFKVSVHMHSPKLRGKA